ncbi:MAG TPA: hypothetical protein VFP86_11145 [bacterium]|nr:hypothetical protein [bacterium]
MRRSWIVRIILSFVLGTGMAMTALTPGGAAQGDASAKAQAVAAFERLNSVPSYRMKSTTSEATVVIEIVRPDKRHFTAQSLKGTVESIAVGREIRTRSSMPGAPAGWRCTTASRLPETFFDMNKMKKDLTEVIRGPDTIIEGTPVHAYTDVARRGTLYVAAATGLPRRLVVVNIQSGKTATIDFSDYGAPITIVLPSCG